MANKTARKFLTRAPMLDKHKTEAGVFWWKIKFWRPSQINSNTHLEQTKEQETCKLKEKPTKQMQQWDSMNFSEKK